MFPDLRLLITATLSTFVVAAAVGLFASMRLVQEPLTTRNEGRIVDESPIDRISLNWPLLEPNRAAALRTLPAEMDMLSEERGERRNAEEKESKEDGKIKTGGSSASGLTDRQIERKPLARQRLTNRSETRGIAAPRERLFMGTGNIQTPHNRGTESWADMPLQSGSQREPFVFFTLPSATP